MTEADRAIIFGRDAGAYELARPDYPTPAIEHVLSLAEVSQAVEVGAGTGKATVSLARPGLRLTCVEPSAGMAEVLLAKRLPGVEVVVSTFEAWPGPGAPVDLVLGAQVWHWLDPEVSYLKTRQMLRPGGAVALVWNIPGDRYAGFEDIYREMAPEVLAVAEERIRRRDSHVWLEELETAGFTDVVLTVFPWEVVLTAGEHRSLFSTYSDHLMLPDEQRERLLDAIEGEVESRGGTITLAYETRVFSAIR